MRGTYQITALFLSFSLTFSSCDKEYSDKVMDVNNEVCTFSFNPIESEYTYGWTAGDIIGISLYKSGTNEIYEDYFDKRYIANNDWAFAPMTNDDIIVRPLSKNEVDFVAYCPHKPVVMDKYVIDIRSQSSQKDIDFLYSNNANNKNNPSRNINLVFDHVLSKIIINSIPGDGYTNVDLEGMNISINNINVIAAFDIRTELFDIYDYKTSILMLQTNNIKSEAIIMPGSSSELSLTANLLNNSSYEIKFPQNTIFKKSTIYHYNLRINRTNVELIPSEIADWNGITNPPDTCVSKNSPYKIGDFYPTPGNSATAIGIVYWLKSGANGREGKITSFDTAMLEWSLTNNYKLGTSFAVGATNAIVIRNVDSTLQQFPAFKWCADKGEGWFLPAKYELHLINESWIANKELINNKMSLVGGEIFTTEDIYLSSSESSDYPNGNVEAYHFDLKDWSIVSKQTPLRVRAVKTF